MLQINDIRQLSHGHHLNFLKTHFMHRFFTAATTATTTKKNVPCQNNNDDIDSLNSAHTFLNYNIFIESDTSETDIISDQFLKRHMHDGM